MALFDKSPKWHVAISKGERIMKFQMKSPLISKFLKGLSLVLVLCTSLSARAEGEQNKSAGYLYAESAEKQEIILPLKKTSAHLELTGGIIHADVKQSFQNTTQKFLEATYVFPLPSQATVTNFEMIYKNKIIKSVVKERKEAEAIYEKAKEEGKKTALLEEERPNIFTTAVANIPPGEVIEIHLSYIEAAPFSKGQYEILFPTVVGPRYIALDQITDEKSFQDAQRITPPLLPKGVSSDHELEISVSLDGIPYEKISSPTHDLDIQIVDSQSAEIKLGKKEIPNRDFFLKVLVKKETGKPLASNLESKSGDKFYNLIHLFPPQIASSQAPISKEIVFLIDTSGSMSGESIEQAKKSLHACLDMLSPQDYFSIVRFSSDYSSYSPQSLIANEANLSAAHLYVGSLRADGGTEMQAALRHVLQRPQAASQMRIVVFLTDGDVGNEKSLMALLQQNLGSTRLFSFGIGSAPNEYLLRKLSELGRGTSQFIHAVSEIDSTMIQFFATLNTPILTQVKVHWQSEDGKEIQGVQSFPKLLPDLFADRPLPLLTRSNKKLSGKMIVEGMLQGKAVSLEYPLKSSNKKHEGIRTLWGRAELDDLLYDYNFPQNGSPSAYLEKTITEKALDYQLITPFTSRVAVEQKITRKDNGEIISVGVPTLLPEGWDRNGLEGTATDDVVWFIIGVSWMAFGLFLYALQKYLNFYASRKGAHHAS